MIVYSTDGKIIGDIENGIFTKKVSGKRHMLRNPPAWCVDAAAFREHIEKNCRAIRIIDQDTRQTYEVSMAIFLDKMKFIDRGFGGQFMLVLHFWQVLAPGQKMLL